MTHRYPFSSSPNPYPTSLPPLVKHRRHFSLPSLPILKSKLIIHSQIHHPSLIHIIKAFQSESKHFFDIFFQYIPLPFRSLAQSLSYAQLQQQKLKLLSLCSQLITKNIHPIITEDLIGIYVGKDGRKEIKLYVDVDYSEVVGSVGELLRAKEIEISNIFKLYERMSLFEYPEIRESVGFEGERVILNSYSGSIEARSPFQSKVRDNGIRYQSFQQLTHNYYNIQTTSNPNPSYQQTQKQQHEISISGKIIYEVKEQISLKSSSPVVEGSKSQNEKWMKPEKDSGAKLEMLLKEYNMYNSDNIVETEIEIAHQQNTPQLHYHQPPIPDHNLRQHQQQLLRQPRVFNKLQHHPYHPYHYHPQIFQQQQQISLVDTYKQQLGSEKKMPKIRNSQFRQTTKQPPTTIVPLIKQIEQKNRVSGENEGEFNKSDRLPQVGNKSGKKESEGKQKERKEKKSEQAQIKSPRSDYKLQNGYYYQQAFGFGFQKNDPLTREFISLFEDGGNGLVEESEKGQQMKANVQIQKIEERQEVVEMEDKGIERINQKVRSAVENSMRTLEMFQKIKSLKK